MQPFDVADGSLAERSRRLLEPQPCHVYAVGFGPVGKGGVRPAIHIDSDNVEVVGLRTSGIYTDHLGEITRAYKENAVQTQHTIDGLNNAFEKDFDDGKNRKPRGANDRHAFASALADPDFVERMVDALDLQFARSHKAGERAAAALAATAAAQAMAAVIDRDHRRSPRLTLSA